MSKQFDENDPRLTAYVLGELSEAERAEVEAELARNETARTIVAEIRQTAELLTRELQQEPDAALAPEQRAAVLDRPRRAEPSRRRFGRFFVLVTSAAACLALFAGVAYMVYMSRERSAGTQLVLLGESAAVRKELAEPEPLAEHASLAIDEDVQQPAGPPSYPKAVVLPPADWLAGDVRHRAEAVGAPVQAKPATALSPPLPAAASGVTTIDTERAKLAKAEMPMRSSPDRKKLAPGGAPAHGGREFSVWTDSASTSETTRAEPAPADGADRLTSLGSLERGVETAQAGRQTGAYGGGMGGLGADKFGRVGASSRGEPLNYFRVEREQEGRRRVLASVDEDEDQRARQWYQIPPDEEPPHRGRPERQGAETYLFVVDNPFRRVVDAPLSTFSIDVDTASYTNIRRFLNQGRLPPKQAVRVEEMVNYFEYDYPQPKGKTPFSVNVEVADCPWKPGHKLARVGLKGKDIQMDDRPPANLVFLLDVSGSMKDQNKLPLLKSAMELLVGRLDRDDKVAIVTYSNDARTILDSTSAQKRQTILKHIRGLSAGGGTNGAAGIETAYDIAADNFVKDGINRVILATDGDFNVGVTERSELIDLIEASAGTGVFLIVLGFGTGNLKDANLEGLADKGNGHYAYIDSFNEARKVLMEQIGGTFFTIAKDVKIQIDFNPGRVDAYRLIGYENRVMADRDFSDDRKDAGEIGAGHTVTAVYELVPMGQGGVIPGVDPSKYQKPPGTPENVVPSDELMTVRLRYKAPDEDTSTPIEVPVPDTEAGIDRASPDFKFAAAVAGFGMLLRDSDYMGDTTYDLVLELARAGRGADDQGYRAEFIGLVKTAQALDTK